jgi:hypothetical protein
MFRPENLRSTIDNLHANVAVLDNEGAIVEVNERWRRFGSQRMAPSDYVGVNYLEVCERSAELGDRSAMRVAIGLKRLLNGEADSYDTAYRCSDHAFRMGARRIARPGGGLLVGHLEITSVMAARRERSLLRRELREVRQNHAVLVEHVHEEIGQALTGITLAAETLGIEGNPAQAIALIKASVAKARLDLKLLRDEAQRDRSEDLF